VPGYDRAVPPGHLAKGHKFSGRTSLTTDEGPRIKDLRVALNLASRPKAEIEYEFELEGEYD
jgi:hypothetical protein